MKTKQLIQEMNKYSENLSNENKELFDKILLKIRFSNISEQDAEEFSHHCLNLLLQAEKEDLTVEQVLGMKDVDAFCNEYIADVRGNYGFFKKVLIGIRILPLVLIIFVGLWEMLISCLLPIWIKQKSFILTVPVTLSMIIDTVFTLLLTWVALRYASRISWDLNHGTKKQDHKWTFIIFIFYLLTIGFFVISKLYFKQILFNIHFLLFIVICAIIYVVQDSAEHKLS
jgi:DNA-binding ferritin-like protein (Dps family)